MLARQYAVSPALEGSREAKKNHLIPLTVCRVKINPLDFIFTSVVFLHTDEGTDGRSLNAVYSLSAFRGDTLTVKEILLFVNPVFTMT